MKAYRTVEARGEAEIIIKKSRFIGQASPVANEEEALAFVTEIKKKHYEATHNCHAWIIDPLNQRSNDDGEPSGTAGRPMLEVLRNEDLEQVAVVVTRYFGGVLLGVGGLVRAYAQSCKAALVAAKMGSMLPHQRLTVELDYSLYGKLENQVREGGISVLDTDFAQQVTVTLGLPLKDVPSARQWLVDLSSGQALVTTGQEYYSFVRGK
jgi:uncharacterized YigZ family protein